MPELPEILHLAGQMDKEFRGITIAAVQVIQEKCINMPVGDFAAMLTGRRIEQVTSKGKWVFVELDRGAWLLLNLGMGGNMLLHENGDSLPGKYQLRFDFTDGRALTIGFWWFGYAHAVSSGDLGSHKMTAKLGPAPLGDADFTQGRFQELLRGRRGAVKNFLLAQDNIAGIGNVYVQDILFHAKLHPNRKLQTLTEAEKSSLYRSIMNTLTEAAELGGLAYEKDIYNQPGRLKDFLVGYRDGQPCPLCGAIIQKIKTGSTASYICPHCQAEETGSNTAGGEAIRFAQGFSGGADSH
jgi:formamidopyrimidine-DNA glycosylase